jgi:hypothetical protein
MDQLRKAWAWVKAHAVALIMGLLAIFGGLAYALSRRGRGMAPGEAIKLRREAQEIARKEQRAADLEKQADDKAPEAAALRAEIAESKRRVMEAQDGPIIQEMDDAQVADLFRRSRL